MAKAPMVVTICSVGIVTMFIVMSYLMATIEPPQLTSSKKNVSLKKTLLDGSRRFQDDSTNLDDSGLPLVDTAQYGLDKSYPDVIDFYRTTKKKSGINYQKHKLIPPLWPKAQEMIVNPTMYKVMQPIWPTTYKQSQTKSEVNNNVKNEYPENNNNTSETNTNQNSVTKPLKRRSVNNYILDDAARSVILNILDYNGQSRVEIKLWLENQLQTKVSKNIDTIQSGKKYDQENNGKSKNTIITIMANNSIVIEEPGGINTTGFLETTLLETSIKESNTSNVTEHSNEFSVENILHEFKPDKILFNTTNSLQFINSSVLTTTYNYTDTATNLSEHLDPKNNGTEFNIFSNDTEFNKATFADVIKRSKIVTNEKSADSDPSDSYHTNDTDLFIENDTDMVY